MIPLLENHIQMIVIIEFLLPSYAFIYAAAFYDLWIQLEMLVSHSQVLRELLILFLRS